MAFVVSRIAYSGGRGRGILGLDLSRKLRKPGEDAEEKLDLSKNSHVESSKSQMRVLFVLYDYRANPDAPGGFPELSVKKGDLLEYLSEHPENEHWWKAKNEDGETGYVPASYVLIKEEQPLPWLAESALENRERERKERLHRQVQQQAFSEGKGFGPAPATKNVQSTQPYVYVSAYNRESQTKSNGGGTSEYYCEVCNKSFNGPKPYKAHMFSKAHKEEVELMEA